MKLNVDQNILERAVALWGSEVQTNKIQEEALELSLVINQMNCPTKDKKDYEEKLYDELADNVIMLHYYPILFDEERLQRIVNKKLGKLERIMGKVEAEKAAESRRRRFNKIAEQGASAC